MSSDDASKFSTGRAKLQEISRRLGSLSFKSSDSKVDFSSSTGLFGVLGSIVDQLDKISEEAHKSGADVGKSGVFGQGVGKRVHGVYGFSIKSGFGDSGIEVEPFGNMKKDSQSGNVEVHAVREPMTDIFDETAHILVVAEVPGVTQADIHVDIEGDILTLTAERGDKKYRKELLLPSSFTAENMGFTCHGGVVEIRLNKWEK